MEVKRVVRPHLEKVENGLYTLYRDEVYVLIKDLDAWVIYIEDVDISKVDKEKWLKNIRHLEIDRRKEDPKDRWSDERHVIKLLLK